MRTASPALQALLDSDAFIFADCFAFTLRDGLGTIVRRTDADRDITLDDGLYTRTIIQGARLRCVRGLEVDEQSITWTPPVGETLRGRPILECLRKGLFDRAVVRQHRAFFADLISPAVGTIRPFTGEVADINLKGGAVTLTVKSTLVLLNVNVPGPLYQAGCRHIFAGSSCGVAADALGLTAAILAGSDEATLYCSLTEAAGTWDHGIVTVTSGANAGLSRSIKASSPGRLDLVGPFPFAPAEGDSIRVTPGCDKTLARCGDYGNTLRFGGMPYVPTPESGT